MGESEKIIKLQNKLQKIVNEVNELNSKPEFYDSVKNIFDFRRTIIEIGIGEETVKKIFDEFENVCIAISMSEFERMEVHNTSEKDIFTHIANCINTVSKELEITTTQKHYLEETIEHITDLAIITDKMGVIKFANQKACELLNQTKENLIQLRIANIFESKTQFESKIWFFKPCQNRPVKLIPYNSNGKQIPVLLTLKELINPRTEVADGYLFIAKEIGVYTPISLS